MRYVMANRDAIYQKIASRHDPKAVESTRNKIAQFIDGCPEIKDLPTGTVALALQMVTDTVTCLILEPE